MIPFLATLALIAAAIGGITIFIPRLYLSKKFSTSAGMAASPEVGTAP